MNASTPAALRSGGQVQRTESTQLLETSSQSSNHLATTMLSPSYSNHSKSQTSLISGLSEKLSSSSRTVPASTSAPAKSKSRLNLLIPMSLLMRRRSGQSLDPLHDESLVTQRSSSNMLSMPDNYDPSIRGSIVHDFNAPRLNRNYTSNTGHGNESQQDLGRVSPPKVDKEHTPIFREHFDDETTYEQSQAAIRAEQLANKDFLARNSAQFLQPEPSPPPPPPLPKDSPPAAPQTFSPPQRPPFQTFDSGSSKISSILSPVQEAPDSANENADVTPRKQKSIKTPPPARSRAASVDPSFQPAGLPAHFSSRASRFSFQIPGGTDSAQEKLLEDRHKAKEAEKASKENRKSTNTIGDEYDDFDMDDFDMDGGFDEEIPMLGEEDHFEGLGNQTLDSNIHAFDFSALQGESNGQSLANSMIPAGQYQCPVDANGNLIGFALSGGMIQPMQGLGISQPTNHVPEDQSCDPDSDKFQEQSEGIPSHASHVPLEQSAVLFDQSSTSAPIDLDDEDEDDMYFDDGLIGDQEVPDDAPFDEDVFDDPQGPLYERKVRFPDSEEAASSQPMAKMYSETGYDADDDAISKHLAKSEPSLAHKTSIAQQRSVPTFDNMEAYHSALADAANRAEASGRFIRKASIDTRESADVDEFSTLSQARPSLVPEDGPVSLDTEVYPPEDDLFGMSSGFVDDYEYSDFDSALEDDPIIAAANAEALAYDDEGFYGQEFGFYASAVGESPSAWGGFFGPSGLGRSVSGRNAVREPNLTPITERSEYSTRNSFISINHFRDGQQPITSPGLAQLARMSPYGWPGDEEDMSLDALMKLRKGAFGGSAASLPASATGSPRNSSPIGMQFVPRSSSPAGNRMKEQTEKKEGIEVPGSLIDDDEHVETQDLGDVDDEVNVDVQYQKKDVTEEPEGSYYPKSDYNTVSSPTSHVVGNEGPLLRPISELYAENMLSPSHHMSLAMSPGGLNLTSASNIALPMSPYGGPLPSPFLAQHNKPSSPPSIDTSLSSPAATVSTSSNAPRRQSMGLISPISNSSPVTPNGSGWRAGHSRKGSAADSVTYVREHDEAGEGRWVLERRRTAESGELELIGREIVEGGRI